MQRSTGGWAGQLAWLQSEKSLLGVSGWAAGFFCEATSENFLRITRERTERRAEKNATRLNQ
jgi:hypothetical protein